MRIRDGVRSLAFALTLLAPGGLLAGEKKLMHCFAYTPIEGASEADWKAFYEATDALPGKIPGLTKVWYGKLRAPLNIYNVDAESRKKVMAGEKSGAMDVTRLVRQHGVCMEMADEATLKSYTTHAAHKEWLSTYEKVRQPGTTTIDILGQ